MSAAMDGRARTPTEVKAVYKVVESAVKDPLTMSLRTPASRRAVEMLALHASISDRIIADIHLDPASEAYCTVGLHALRRGLAAQRHRQQERRGDRTLGGEGDLRSGEAGAGGRLVLAPRQRASEPPNSP
jgi:hypothetical protein